MGMEDANVREGRRADKVTRTTLIHQRPIAGRGRPLSHNCLNSAVYFSAHYLHSTRAL